MAIDSALKTGVGAGESDGDERRGGDCNCGNSDNRAIGIGRRRGILGERRSGFTPADDDAQVDGGVVVGSIEVPIGKRMGVHSPR